MFRLAAFQNENGGAMAASACAYWPNTGPRPNIDEYYSSGSIGFRKRDNYLLGLLGVKQAACSWDRACP